MIMRIHLISNNQISHQGHSSNVRPKLLSFLRKRRKKSHLGNLELIAGKKIKIQILAMVIKS